MAFDNFKPTIWSAHVQLELERDCILVASCNTKFQGEAGQGKRVKIVGAARPTVKTYTPGSDIADAETPQDTSIYLDTDQYKYVHFLVDNVDEAQSVDGLMSAYMQGAREELAVHRDEFVASLAADATYATSTSSANTADKAIALLNTALIQLRNNDVKISTSVVIEVTPWFYYRIKDKLVELKTNNDELIKQGIINMYDGAAIKMTNSLYNDTTDDYIMVRTKNAIAFAGGIEKVEAYTPEKQFSDAIKMLDTFGAKIVRPKELYVIKAHNGA